ncbi:hypothetical protein PABG_06219 [Paracoccidioides brasiliensis Pb03]|uniref:Very-long-chain 3-oxoacyl-CoA reductase n=1 Tax=Paracoccidioides brasiliensis (strain Pb18) TaxID=502780 RepID=C1GKG2_PARBD|nr:uncharacterized protein PADG_07748 [Paracoccidioides brasiliensis Pb18]EEH16132.1 hypothetical protein PABG_06219 [Paracoccidioides brasiliensis Pb03]EEH42928.1 hypothetical protein PADG_07748 [Paracoccidioides brasiliensis Pb18]
MDSSKIVLSVFTAVGALALLHLLFIACQHIYTLFLRPSSLPKYLDKTRGSYALVTGSTEGTGTEFARELCRYGFNIVLHGRNPEKLSHVEASLRREFPLAKFRHFIFDASQPTHSLDEAVTRTLHDIPLAILVNNVGGTGGQIRSQYTTLKGHTNDEADRIINVNLRFMTQLTRVLLPLLERHSPALIVNISSVTAVGMPYLTVYAGTKAYIQSFTNGLNMEMKAEGKQIDVMSMVLASVQTAGNPLGRGFFVPTPDKIARSSLRRVGCGCVSVTPYWRHRLQKLAMDVLPAALVRRLVVYNIKGLKAEADEQERRKATNPARVIFAPR